MESVGVVCMGQLAFAAACGFIWFSSRVSVLRVMACLFTVMPFALKMRLLHFSKEPARFLFAFHMGVFHMRPECTRNHTGGQLPVCSRVGSREVLPGVDVHSVHGSQHVLMYRWRRVVTGSCFYWHAKLWVRWHVRHGWRVLPRWACCLHGGVVVHRMA